jgi:hypothetical protein
MNSREEDPLARAPQLPERGVYAQGILLDALDFETEQTYHRGRLARALAYLHGSGTVAGLQVVWERSLDPGADPEWPQGREERLVVQPGIAIDRIGRVIEVPRAFCLRLAQWYQAQNVVDLRQGLHAEPYNGVVADVFVHFIACKRGKTPAFAPGLFDATNANVPARLRDSHACTLVIRTETPPPLPQDPWPDLATMADVTSRRAALRNAILNAWKEDTAWKSQDGLKPLPEHALGQDATAVFLARLTLPAVAGADPQLRPVRDLTAPVDVDNHSRLFVYTTGALVRWLGI